MTDMHPSWKPLTPESWKGAQDVWLLAGVWIYSAEGEAKDVCAEYLPALCTHWQPAILPPVYADAQPSARREWYVAFYSGGEAQYVYDTQPTHRRTVKVREVLPGDDAQPSELVDQLRIRRTEKPNHAEKPHDEANCPECQLDIADMQLQACQSELDQLRGLAAERHIFKVVLERINATDPESYEASLCRDALAFASGTNGGQHHE